MAKYFKDKNIINVAPDGAAHILDTLPADVYTLNFNVLSGFYLEIDTSFTVPDHIYGDVEVKVNKIIKSYNHKTNNLGVLLSGEKGSGKTMMLRLISKKCQELGIPTVVINKDFEEDFCKYISNINQRCVIVFDEFEKVFSGDDQSKLLTLFEGVYTSNKLFILTVNDIYRLSEFFKNRPGRLHYHIEFDSLDEGFIKEYCDRNLDNKKHIGSIINLSKLISKFNFDMLQAIVFECNLHEESPNQAFKMLNIRDVSRYDTFGFEVKSEATGNTYTGSGRTRIFSSESFIYSDICVEDVPDEEKCSWVYLTEENLVSAKNGVFVFKDGEYTIKLSRKDVHVVGWDF